MVEIKKKVLIVFGTRPEAIKMAPLIKKIDASLPLKAIVCVTAQHREMLDGVLQLFKINPQYDLDLMSQKQSITDLTTGILNKMKTVLDKEKPDLVLVHGDTTTTFASALAAFYRMIPVGHIEAGLRSGDIYSPYPEEMNRRITSAIATLHFAPTEENKLNLLRCGVNAEQIFVTGNTVIDALYEVIRTDFNFPEPWLNGFNFNHQKIILLTAHRRENWGESLQNIFEAVKNILKGNPDTELIFPVHLNPAVREPACKALGPVPRAHLTPPLDYETFVNLMARCYLVLTDSGGIQEEAPALGKPVVVLRRETERPEAVLAGTVKVAGVEPEKIYQLTHELLNNPEEYEKVARAVSPYGDGKAAERIVDALLKWFA